MMYDLLERAVLIGLLMLAMRNLWQFMTELAFEGWSLLTAEPDATDGPADSAEVAEVVDPAEVAEVADTVDVAGEALSAAADGGGWDFLELFEGLELG